MAGVREMHTNRGAPIRGSKMIDAEIGGRDWETADTPPALEASAFAALPC
jgi:hypothetical protein